MLWTVLYSLICTSLRRKNCSLLSLYQIAKMIHVLIFNTRALWTQRCSSRFGIFLIKMVTACSQYVSFVQHYISWSALERADPLLHDFHQAFTWMILRVLKGRCLDLSMVVLTGNNNVIIFTLLRFVLQYSFVGTAQGKCI